LSSESFLVLSSSFRFVSAASAAGGETRTHSSPYTHTCLYYIHKHNAHHLLLRLLLLLPPPLWPPLAFSCLLIPFSSSPPPFASPLPRLLRVVKHARHPTDTCLYCIHTNIMHIHTHKYNAHHLLLRLLFQHLVHAPCSDYIRTARIESVILSLPRGQQTGAYAQRP
jgi:hypothetical protein